MFVLVYQNKKFSYVTEKIKYYLRKIDDDITKLTLVIDDIDAIKCWELIRNLIREACGTWECVRNDPEKKYNVKLLISEREETHRHLHKEYTEQWITAYIWEDEPIYICEGPPLAELFKKRFDCITEIEKNDTAANLEKWEIAYDALNELVSKTFTKRNEEIITCLNNRNVRGTLTTVAQILSLGDWIEKNPRDKNYHFDVTVDKFNENIDVIQILRAIGYYNKFYYRDDPPRSRMPNILYNKEDSSTDLIGLYIIKFFLTQYEHLSNNTKEPIDIDILYNNIPVILLEGKSAVQKFQDVIKYFLEREVLSIHPFDDGSKKFLKLNNRGKILWDLLSENNILLELFKDDIWYESQNKIRERMLAQREAVPMRFLEEIEIISFYSKIERKIIKELFTNEQKKIYLATFGYSTVTNQLANGIKESFHKYYQNIHDRPHEVTIELNKMLDEVKSLQRTMQSIN
ncbi:MAG: hypothetical protein KIT26_08390 [Nitrosomonas sp.]|nr:hypothetical protein [Nitrosomonas sp.]